MATRPDWRGWVLVGVQFACLANLAVSGPLIAAGPWLLLEGAGLLLGVWVGQSRT